jgi:hypothetical protein
MNRTSDGATIALAVEFLLLHFARRRHRQGPDNAHLGNPASSHLAEVVFTAFGGLVNGWYSIQHPIAFIGMPDRGSEKF